jgi:hypothetical protein
MKKDLREIYWAPNRAAAEAAVDAFPEKHRAKYGRAVECLAIRPAAARHKPEKVFASIACIGIPLIK